MANEVRIFTLSTCGHCKAAKRFMTEIDIPFDFTDVDLLAGDERKAALAEMAKYNPNRTFPTLLIRDRVIVGFSEKQIREALGMT